MMDGLTGLILGSPLPFSLSVVLNIVLLAAIKFMFYPIVKKKEELETELLASEKAERQLALERFNIIVEQYENTSTLLTSLVTSQETMNTEVSELNRRLEDLKYSIEHIDATNLDDVTSRLSDITRQCQSLIQTQATLTGVLLGGNALSTNRVDLSGVK